MTLTVDPVLLNADEQWELTDLEPRYPCNDLFGTQDQIGPWTSFADVLGLTLLSRLRNALPVFYSAAELDDLEREAQTLNGELSRLVSADSVEYYAFRLRNLVEAIRLARTLPKGRGGVEVG